MSHGKFVFTSRSALIFKSFWASKSWTFALTHLWKNSDGYLDNACLTGQFQLRMSGSMFSFSFSISIFSHFNFHCFQMPVITFVVWQNWSHSTSATRCYSRQADEIILNLEVFKPGACRPLAGVRLVFWNCFCPQCEHVCVCVSAPEAINN